MPVMLTATLSSGPLPVFLSVMAWVALEVPLLVLGKVSEVGVRVTAGLAPVPVNDTVCGEGLALSATLTEAVNVPVVVGLKVTVMVQLALADTLVPQLFVCE